MSGIVGYLNLNAQAVDRQLLDKMVDVLAHRGPDGAKVWNEGVVGLGHRMLWTTPESLNEMLPLQSGNLTITADARIDNRDDLLRQLDFGGRQPKDIADSEIILEAYLKWGDDCPDKLLGDFAFSIWDESEQKLFCARDYFGVKPFYYYHAPHRFFAFASEIKGLLCLPDVPKEINDVMIAEYLSFAFEDESNTFFENIFRLPPAHTLVIQNGNMHIRSYWDLDPTQELRLGSDEEYAERYRELFTESVRARMRSAFPVGSMLSGGLDSSSITCVARDLLREKGAIPLPTFSGIYEHRMECDEREYMEAVHSGGGFEPHFIFFDHLRPLGNLGNHLWHIDQPYYAPNLFTSAALWQTAKQQDVRVLLEGFMGDQVVSNGETYLVELARKFQFRQLSKEIHALEQQGQLDASGNFVWKYIKREGLKPRIPAPMLQLWHNLQGREAPEPHVDELINPAFAQKTGLATRLMELQGHHYMPSKLARAMHYYQISSGINSASLETLNHVSQGMGLDVRLPYLDKRLVEFCLAIPAQQKLSDGWPRMIVRRGMRDILPEAICWRNNKANMSSNFTGSLLDFEQTKMEDIVFRDCEILEPYINLPKLHEIYRRFTSRGGGDDGSTIVSNVMLATWLRQAVYQDLTIVSKLDRG